jgi:hypothetical protein
MVLPLIVVPMATEVDPPPLKRPPTITLDRFDPRSVPLVILNTFVPDPVAILTVPLLKVQLPPDPLSGPVVSVTVP